MALRTVGTGSARRVASFKELERIGVDPRKPIDNPDEVLRKLGKGGGGALHVESRSFDGDPLVITSEDGKMYWNGMGRDSMVQEVGTRKQLDTPEARAFEARAEAYAKAAKKARLEAKQMKGKNETSEQRAIRKQKEREYDRIYNEGGEGFNPYRD